MARIAEFAIKSTLGMAIAAIVAGCPRLPAPPPPPPPYVVPEFPWPVPKPSRRLPVPEDRVRKPESQRTSLGDVDVAIGHALSAAGYYERSYYHVPGGFAVVTQLEATEEDGRPKPEPHRWYYGDEGPSGFKEYLHRLFTAPAGYYRAFVFIVSPAPIVPSDSGVTVDSLRTLASGGGDRLPSRLASWEYGTQYRTTLLIYEFERTENEESPKTRIPGRLSAMAHIQASGVQLWN